MTSSAIAQNSAAQSNFVIEREYASPPAAVFRAWADPVAKRAWSDCHPQHTTAYSLDFRPYGRESQRVVNDDQSVLLIEKVFFDIVQDRRILFAYDICIGGRRLSVSLVTVEFMPGPKGTRMTYAEQLSYLDGHDDREQRIQGTQEGLDRLALALAKPGSAH